MSDICAARVNFFTIFVAAVVLKRYTQVLTICTAEVPRMSCPYFSMCDDVTTQRLDGCCVIIKWAMKICPCRSGGVEGCLSEQVKGEFSLWE